MYVHQSDHHREGELATQGLTHDSCTGNNATNNNTQRHRRSRPFLLSFPASTFHPHLANDVLLKRNLKEYGSQSEAFSFKIKFNDTAAAPKLRESK